MKKIYIVGVGIKGFKQITLEAIEIIKKSQKVYHLTLFHDDLVKLNSNT
jgi:precorrin-6B methylase 1